MGFARRTSLIADLCFFWYLTMLSVRGFWRRHKRKLLVGVGILGSGYVLFRLYSAHRGRLDALDRELEGQRQAEEHNKAKLQDLFVHVQRFSDTVTLPDAMRSFRSRICEELDLFELRERLMQGKGASITLTRLEKLELWDRLKILSFTRTLSSLWGVTMLSLHIRVQGNILGRHLIIDAARDLDEVDQFNRHGQEKFLTADYLSNHGMSMLIPAMQRAATVILKDKRLNDPFSPSQLYDTMVRILEFFMSMGDPPHWVVYMVPENASMYKDLASAAGSFDDSLMFANASKLDQLMVESRAVLLSDDFANLAELSLKKVLEGLMEDIATQLGGSSSSGVPLVKLLPSILQSGDGLLEDPSKNKFIHSIRSLPEIELFYTLLYANMPPVS